MGTRDGEGAGAGASCPVLKPGAGAGAGAANGPENWAITDGVGARAGAVSGARVDAGPGAKTGTAAGAGAGAGTRAAAPGAGTGTAAGAAAGAEAGAGTGAEAGAAAGADLFRVDATGLGAKAGGVAGAAAGASEGADTGELCNVWVAFARDVALAGAAAAVGLGLLGETSASVTFTEVVFMPARQHDLSQDHGGYSTAQRDPYKLSARQVQQHTVRVICMCVHVGTEHMRSQKLSVMVGVFVCTPVPVTMQDDLYILLWCKVT